MRQARFDDLDTGLRETVLNFAAQATGDLVAARPQRELVVVVGAAAAGLSGYFGPSFKLDGTAAKRVFPDDPSLEPASAVSVTRHTTIAAISMGLPS